MVANLDVVNHEISYHQLMASWFWLQPSHVVPTQFGIHDRAKVCYGCFQSLHMHYIRIVTSQIQPNFIQRQIQRYIFENSTEKIQRSISEQSCDFLSHGRNVIVAVILQTNSNACPCRLPILLPLLSNLP